MMVIKCIKGFLLDGGSLPIMKGELYELTNDVIDDLVFTSMNGFNPGMEMCFEADQLCEYFEVVN
tara:strand:- start:250 stop:444 length:195 start_codon:yes stop_codon:yes gene_type:complete